ncbi:rRNA maturation RNase YbeY [Solitalea koreensis]|uniref:Endoribonuclease YbeY n=1 Tax=Solitalea koreensis TaxID=543615 RepID=A0A521C3J9_9SPHI|nr:rRNA maturation RNase YbeY [Solitalea koreensis]SMO53391.1 rRNA maturation RNase YbeY [Solitalea koreensis]
MAISFFTEDIKFDLKNKLAVKKWIQATAKAEGKKLKEINYIFCSDEYLLNINQTYLDHDTYTDIVTFDNSEKEGEIISDIFISVERTRENAQKFSVPEIDELHRVMIHGVLHLCGYKDKTDAQQKLMREKEDFYLGTRS